MPTEAVDGSGLLWLEVERDTVLSRPVPILMAADIDVVEEVLDLEENLLQGRCGPFAAAIETFRLCHILSRCYCQCDCDFGPGLIMHSRLSDMLLPCTAHDSKCVLPCCCRMSAQAVEQLLLKLGSVLEFAEPFVGRMPQFGAAEDEHAGSSQGQWDERLGNPTYMWAMVTCARYLLAECCKRSWPAVAAKVGPISHGHSLQSLI